MMTQEAQRDIVLIFEHPHGALEIPLDEWRRVGPGERTLLSPVRAKRVSTGEDVPLSAIPLELRNTPLSRFLIRVGALTSPWQGKPSGR